MENFNFHHVLLMMQWTYAREDDGIYSPWKIYNGKTLEVPTLQELKDMADRQLQSVIDWVIDSKTSRYSIRSGPFSTSYESGILFLECVFESWDGM